MPDVARQYYESSDLYLFDEFQAGGQLAARRPRLRSLLDVFEAVRDDEGQHAATMRLCQQAGKLRSPHDDDAREMGETCDSAIDCASRSPTGVKPPPPPPPQ